MRLKVDFHIDKLPITYNTLFMSAIKEAIKASDVDYYEKLYFYQDKSNKATKNLTFSVAITDYMINEGFFYIKGKSSFIISTPDLKLGLLIYNGMLKKRKFVYKDMEWKVNRVDLLKEREFTSREVAFKTLSPICIQDKNGRYMAPDEAKYEEELNYIMNEILKNYRGSGLKERLSFRAIEMKKVVVKETIRAFKEKTGRDYLGVNAYRGSFVLRGDAEDLADVYQLGIGFKRSQGFGNIDVLEWR